MQINIEHGFVYHIADSYFNMAKDEYLMRNHDGDASRPTYICLKDEKTEIFWAIPMSSRIEKYETLISQDNKRYGKCVKVMIARYGEKSTAFLFQNMFPVTAKYIDPIHTIGGKPAPLSAGVRKKVRQAFKECLRLHKQGAKVIFTNIERLEKLMRDELNM